LAFAVKLCAAVSSLIGVVLGVVGTYLMTSAYHPFNAQGVMYDFLHVVFLFLTFRWKRGLRMIGDAAFFGEVNPEDRRRSLLGIYVLGVSFLFQTAGAALFVLDVFAGSK
jgi:hypothetical protein